MLPVTAKLLIKHQLKHPTFYLLPKIHKLKNHGCPIMSACSCPTEHTSAYLDTVLQSIVQSLLTYVKDSTHALTMDVILLYSCLPHSDGLKSS